MSDAGNTEYVPDHLYERLFEPWTLPEAEWPLCKEDWARVDAITRLPWKGKLLDFGAGDGTLAAMVVCRNHPDAFAMVECVEQDERQRMKMQRLWSHLFYLGRNLFEKNLYDGALCCEVLEHMDRESGRVVLKKIKTALKPGGMLCVTVPFSCGSRADYPGHVTKWDRGQLEDALCMFGSVTTSVIAPTTSTPIWLMAVCHA